MRKNLKGEAVVFPMPVLLIATYNEDGSVDVMNAAWGTAYETNQIKLNISEGHKTTQNIKRTRAFTVSLADGVHVVEADYFGMISGNNKKDKFEKSGLHAIKSEHVNAPIIEELPICMECTLAENQEGYGVLGNVVNVSVDAKFLNPDGTVNVDAIRAIAFDSFNHGYYEIGKKVGQAFSDGKKLM